jgi:hypothetical protein
VSLFSLAEFAAKLVAIDRDLKAAQPEILAEGCCAMVAGRAKDRSQAQADGGGFQRDDAGRR